MLKRALPLSVLKYRRDRLLAQRACECLRRSHSAVLLAEELNFSVRTLYRLLHEEATSLFLARR